MILEKIIAVRNTKTIFQQDDKCIKVFNHEYTNADVLNEAFNQAMAKASGLSVPKVIQVSEIEGRWAIVSEYAKGNSLAYLIEKEPEKREYYLNMFLDMQINVHFKSCPNLKRLRDQMNRRIQASDLRATDRFALHTTLAEMPVRNKLLHGDFTPSNVIISPDGTPFIIDWSHAVQGNASADAAITFMNFMLKGLNDTAKRYIELYCEKSGTDIEYVKKWIPVAAAAMSVKFRGNQKKYLTEFAENTINRRISI